MSNKKNLTKEVDAFQRLDEHPADLDAQLDDFMKLLENSNLDSLKAKHIREKFERAVDHATQNHENGEPFQTADQFDQISRLQMLDSMQILLSNNDLNSKDARKYLLQIRIKKVVMGLISLLLIVLGFAMIIMPAPPSFEMFTIFYFTPDDGVTLMDLISLLIVLSGIYLLIRTVFLKPQQIY